MLKRLLEAENCQLFVAENVGLNGNHIPTFNYIIGINISRQAAIPQLGLPNFLIINNGNHYRTFFLPWQEDSGFYIDLSSSPDIDMPGLFLTSAISGCCIGVQNLGGIIRVRHYNIQGGRFNIEDFLRYENVKWLLPENYRGMLPGAQIYRHDGGFRPAAFWGERNGSKWNFYYQNYGVTIVNEFNYNDHPRLVREV